MVIGYLRLDFGDENAGTYNSQEIGLAKAYEKLGHKVYIFYWMERGDERCFTNIPLSGQIEKVYLPCRYRIGHHVVVDMNLLKSYRLDLMHIQTDTFLYAPNAIKYCKRRSIRYYCYIGTIRSRNTNRIFRFIFNKLAFRNIRAMKGSIVFAKTPAVADELKRLGVNKVTVAPVGLDLSIVPDKLENPLQLKQKYGIAPEKKLVLSVCALRAHKHPFDIFRLAQMLDDGYCIVHIGDGELREDFMNELKTKTCYGKIVHIGKLPNAKVHSFYHCADYFVNFNSEEIFGMAILEAMYQGCTVIAIHAPGPDYIIENGKSGFLVDSVSEMVRVINDAKRVVNPRERILGAFTWDKTVALFLSKFN